MQRILSVEASRCSSSGDEIITKKFCCSLSLAVSFLALVGGFLLGKATTERAFAARRCIEKQPELNNYIEFMKNLSFTTMKLDNSLEKINENNINYDELYDKLKCQKLSVILNIEDLRHDVRNETKKAVRSYLELMAHCFISVNDYLNITSGYNVDDNLKIKN